MNTSLKPWYKDGLKFKCTGCGKCCTGPRAFVWIDKKELKEMAEALGLTEQQFKIMYVRNRGNRLSLVEKKHPNGFACVFLKDNKCEIYQARPRQCRTFPWWPENLTTEESWKLAALECEGINEKAPLINFKQIKDNLDPN